MPLIRMKYSASLSQQKEEALKTRFGKAIALLPGKSEQWLMAEFCDNCRLWFQGSQKKPIALIEVSLFGSAPDGAYEKLTGELTAILKDECGLDPAYCYVKYDEISHWGWNGSNF